MDITDCLNDSDDASLDESNYVGSDDETLISITGVPEDVGEYEAMVVKLDPTFDSQVEAVEITKNYIITHKLIVYGGTAIDFALRLKGGNIYSDSTLAIPDLDFYSPNNITDAYAIASELYEAGFEEVRAFPGVHITTQKVDIVDGHIVADVSFCPKNVFDILPTLEYLGMRIVHPWYQLIDMHSALSFLYDEPPREVVFHRIAKDIKRAGAVLKYYPVTCGPGVVVPKVASRAFTGLKKYVLTGDLAYAYYYREYADLRGSSAPAPGIVPLELSVVGATTTCAVDALEVVSIDMKATAESIGVGAPVAYEALFNLFPERIEGTLKGSMITEDASVTIYSTHNRLLSIVTLGPEDNRQRVVCIQYLLRHYLAKYHYTKEERYLAFYVSLMAMIPTDCAVIDTPFYISVEYYGSNNQSHTYEMRKMYINRDLGTGLAPVQPRAYYPNKGPMKPSIPENIPGFDITGRALNLSTPIHSSAVLSN